jgi:hypothetical protein
VSRSYWNLAVAVLALSLSVLPACGGSPPNQPPALDTDPASTTIPVAQPQANPTDTTVEQTTSTAGPKVTVPTPSTSTLAPTTSLPATATTVDAPLPTIDYDEPTEGFESEEPNNEQFITYEPDT